MLHAHGGGFVLGEARSWDGPCAIVALASGRVVVSVDYRLSPEYLHPAALEDLTAALHLLRDDPAAVGAGDGPVGLVGDSAGATLCAVVALEAPAGAVDRQVLINPAGDLTADTGSARRFAEGYFFTRADLHRFLDLHLPAGADPRDPRLSPALAPDLHRAPPTMVVTSECDVLRDDGEQLAAALRAAGIAVRHERVPGAVHGFTMFPAVLDAARRVLTEAGRFLSGRIGP